MTYYLNGGNVSDRSSTGQPIPPSAPGAAIGEATTTHRYHGHIGEIIIFSRKLDQAERQKIENYLSQKFSISIEE